MKSATQRWVDEVRCLALSSYRDAFPEMARAEYLQIRALRSAGLDDAANQLRRQRSAFVLRRYRNMTRIGHRSPFSIASYREEIELERRIDSAGGA